MSKVALETERLLLREITHADFAGLHAVWSDAEVMRYFPRTLDEEAMRAWIERNLKRYEQYGHGLWAVILKETGQFTGDCGLMWQDVEGVEELEVGYHFNQTFWGRGLATEAARGCLNYALQQLGRRRIISLIRPENLPSRRVAERNGLQIEKEVCWRGYQHLVYVKAMS